MKPRKSPLVVLGNQKSGTTAIAALLAHHGGLSSTLDFRYLRADDLESLSAGRIRFPEFAGHYGLDFSRELIKEPHLSLFVDELVDFIPNARLVMVVRDPRDNIRSILNRLGLRGDVRSYEPADLEQVNPSWRLVLDGSWAGIQASNPIEHLAERWVRIAQSYLDGSRPMALVRYEDFVADKPGEIHRLAERCSVTARRDIQKRVNIQYQPAGDHSIGWTDFFGEENLNTIEAVCSGWMEPLGYAPIHAGRQATAV